MTEPADHTEARRVLEVAPTADATEIKRAYRRLARERHPDRGGDPARFHELQVAFECLVAQDPRAPSPQSVGGRPSRTVRAPDEVIDLASVDWEVRVPTAGMRLDRHRAAVALVSTTEGWAGSVTATSRAPGSRSNALAPHLAPNMTSSLRIFPDSDDQGAPTMTIEIRAWNRRSRRTLDRAPLLGRWKRLRGSSTTSLRTGVIPGVSPRETAVKTIDVVEQILAALEWPLDAWTMTS